MTWNYRIIELSDGSGFALHEVHYDKGGKERSMTEGPAAFSGDSPEEIIGSLMRAKMDATRRPVFKEPDNWG